MCVIELLSQEELEQDVRPALRFECVEGYKDYQGTFRGIVLHDQDADDWAWMILVRSCESSSLFRVAINVGTSLATREEARDSLLAAIRAAIDDKPLTPTTRPKN